MNKLYPDYVWSIVDNKFAPPLLSMLFCRKMFSGKVSSRIKADFYIDNNIDLGGRRDRKIQQKSSNLCPRL